LKVSAADFEAHRRNLAKKGGRDPSTNDAVWSILNSLVTKHPSDRKKLALIYTEMAELAAGEWRDPTLYLSQASTYSLRGFVTLRRNRDPIDEMILRQNEARDLESQGRIDEAIAIYELLLAHAFPHPVPYERLRIIYAKEGRLQDAIRACKAFLRVEKKVGYPERAQAFREAILKLEKRIKPISTAGG